MMNCEYILQNDFHERYVLGKLSDSEKSDYEKHLKECANCQKNLQEERRLIEGVKYAARQEMKLDIQKQTAQLKKSSSKTDWTIAFKVAAVMFFLVLMPSMIYLLKSDFRMKQMEPSLTQVDYYQKDDGLKLAEEEVVDEDESEPSAEEKEEVESFARQELRERSDRRAASKKSVERPAPITDDELILDEISPIPATPDEDRAEETMLQALGAGGREKEADKISRDLAGDDVLSESVTQPMATEDRKKVKATSGVEFHAIGSTEQNIQTYRLKNVIDGVTVRRNNAIISKRSAYAEGQKLQTLNFVSDKKQLFVQNQMQMIPSIKNENGFAADTFYVSMITKDEDVIQMEWYPNFDISGYLPDQIEVQLIDDKIMQLQFGKDLNYLINLDADSLKAIRQK